MRGNEQKIALLYDRFTTIRYSFIWRRDDRSMWRRRLNRNSMRVDQSNPENVRSWCTAGDFFAKFPQPVCVQQSILSAGHMMGKKSRRKKETRHLPPNRKKSRPDDYFRYGHLEVARFGKTVLMRNRMSQEQAEAIQAKLIEHLPGVVREIDNIIPQIDLPGQIRSSVNVTLGRHEGGQQHAQKTVHTRRDPSTSADGRA